MRILMLFFAIATFLPASAHGQRLLTLPPASYDRDEIARLDRWRRAKKLTYLESVPASPRPDGECLRPELSEGQVGYVDTWAFSVLQVHGPRDLLLTVGSRVVWLTGYPTKGLADRDEVRVVGPVEVLAPRSYTTVGGANATVHCVQLMDRERLAELTAERVPQRPIRQPKPDFEARTWASADGRFSVKATFVRYIAGEVTIRRSDNGREVTVPAEKLSKNDREYLAALASLR